ncbi:MAG: hypothetical protein AAF902_23605, partial [Chloroflexota bacterium]
KPLPSRKSQKAKNRGNVKRPSYLKETDRNGPKKKVQTSVPDASRIEAQRSSSHRPAASPKRSTRPERPKADKTEAEFSTGDRVMHPKFGQGIVMDSKLTGADEEVTIAFTGAGVKRLVASFAKLEKIE